MSSVLLERSGLCGSGNKHQWTVQNVNVRLRFGGLHIPPQDLQQLSHPVEVLRLINKTAERTGQEAEKGGDKRQDTEMRLREKNGQTTKTNEQKQKKDTRKLVAERHKVHVCSTR